MKKILIIDDEIHIVELLKFNLENNGYKVDYSYDGFDGYLKTKEFQPDLILLDWMLANSCNNVNCKKYGGRQIRGIRRWGR